MKYECTNDLIANTCMKKVNSTNTDLEVCGANLYCNYDANNDGLCKDFSYISKQFIGGPCNTPADCRGTNPTCVNNVCVADTTTCTTDYDCAINSFCGPQGNITTCVAQKSETNECTKTSECKNNLMCNNGKCTKILSIEDGELVKATDKLLCKSGFVLDGKCSSASLKSNGTCTDKCTYVNNGTEINSTTSCVCGKNFNGDRYCNFGADSVQHKNYMDLIRPYLNLNLTEKCHGTERFTPCISSAFDRNSTTHNNFDFQKTMKNFHNQILLNNVEFLGQTPDSCILPVVGAYDKNMIKPLTTNKCPMYTCGSEKTFCTSSQNPNNFDSSEIKITLNKVCNSTQECPLPVANDIYNKENVQTKCDNVMTNKNKFPGENCATNEDCVNKNCTNKVCQYVKLDGSCSNTDPIDFTKQCGIGAYCNATNICVPQIKRDQNCTSTFHCENNLACYNSTCSLEYGSVKDGQQIDTTLLSKDFEGQYDLLCATMKFDTITKRCYTYKYANMTSMVPNSAGYVACNKTAVGGECKYDLSINKTMVQNCQCGYNADGQGYCPIDFSKGIFIF